MRLKKKGENVGSDRRVEEVEDNEYGFYFEELVE